MAYRPPSACARALIAALLLAGTAAALYDKGGPVLQLTHRSFDKVTKSKVPVVVEFYAPWCGHCKSLAPAFAKAADKLQGIVPFVAVDCDKEANKPLCGQYGVQGFPTIKLFQPGSSQPTDYQGPREAKPLSDAAVGLLTAKHVKKVKNEMDVVTFLQGSGTKVVLVTDKPRTSPMFKSLSQRFAGQLQFGEAMKNKGNTALLEQYGLSDTPKLMAQRGDGSRDMYAGEMKAPKIIEWLKQLAAGSSGGSSGGSKPQAEGGEKQQEKQQEQKEEKKDVQEIPQVVEGVKAAGLARHLEKEGVVAVAFFAGAAGGACREQLDKLNAAVHGQQGMVSGVQVDVSEGKQAAAVSDMYGITPPAADEGTCAIKVYLLPFDKDDHEDSDEWRSYEGQLAAKDLHKAALELFPSSSITPLDAGSHSSWMGMSIMRIKVLLFTDKEEPPALYRALSSNYKRYQMDFGMVSSKDEKLMKQFNVQKVPSIVASFPAMSPDGKPPQRKEDLKVSVHPFIGQMRYGNIANWLTFLGIQTGNAPPDAFRQFAGGSGGFGGATRKDAMVALVTDQESWEASCLSKGGVCIVAALSSGSEEQQEQQLAVLRAAAEGRADQPLHFCWFEASAAGAGAGAGGAPAAQQFAADLGLDAGSVPALVAVAPKKERTAILTGRFEQDSLSQWLDGLLSGKVRTSPLQQLPQFPAPAAAAAAAAAAASEQQQEEAVEEEFDLSDIMNEELEGDLSKAALKDEL